MVEDTPPLVLDSLLKAQIAQIAQIQAALAARVAQSRAIRLRIGGWGDGYRGAGACGSPGLG
ncbi:hypothetical protein OHR68_27425 [Spirillospora sp. NBC_00431]